MRNTKTLKFILEDFLNYIKQFPNIHLHEDAIKEKVIIDYLFDDEKKAVQTRSIPTTSEELIVFLKQFPPHWKILYDYDRLNLKSISAQAGHLIMYPKLDYDEYDHNREQRTIFNLLASIEDFGNIELNSKIKTLIKVLKLSPYFMDEKSAGETMRSKC